MALTINVAKISVTEPQPGMFNVVLNLTCLDGAVEVINRDFNQPKKDAKSIVAVQESFRVEMQAYIDQYLREQVLFTHPTFDSSVTALEASLVGE